MKICVKCKKEMYCKKNGVIVRWRGYYCRSGDKFKCPECKSEIITGFGAAFENSHEISKNVLIEIS